VERLRVARELHARIEVRPGAEPEDAEPELLVGRGRDGDRLRAARRAAAPRLVDQVDGEAATQEDVLEPLAPVRGRLPSLGGLPMAVPENEWKFSGVDRDLVEDVSVIAVQRLPSGISSGGVVR